MTPSNPSRRRLTQAEFDAELKRAAAERTEPSHPLILRASKDQIRAITRTGRRRSWWQRGWKR